MKANNSLRCYEKDGQIVYEAFGEFVTKDEFMEEVNKLRGDKDTQLDLIRKMIVSAQVVGGK